ncbi:MAG: DUF5060 domain-containing protein [Planctomycetes bacterium]|nr:DUF5060 domain-containing protein [Planctomycetota bacterium]
MRRMPLLHCWLVVALSAFTAAMGAEGRRPRILDVRPSAGQVGTFEAFELTLRLDAEFANPFDPDEIDVWADVADPTGRVRRVHGFIHQDYARTLKDGKEQLAPRGERVWRVRYAPMAPGEHRYQASVRTRGGEAKADPGAFAAVPSKSPGFIQVSPRNPRYFEFSTGRPYFPIGHNICWADSQLKTYDYDDYFRKMAAASENFTRIWMCSWSLELEGSKLDDYRLDNAWRLDHIISFARTYGIHFKLCFDNFYDFAQRRHSPYWRAHGGPCDKPADFFTSEAAKAHYRRRLRYITARWAHAPQIMAWEFWNEMDYAPSDRGKVLSRKEPYMLEWTAAMAAELRRLDPYGHLVTNTLAAYTDWPEFWAMPALDFVQLHSYICDDWEPTPKQYDAAAMVLDQAQDFAQFKKPFLIAEFGYQPSGGVNRLNKLDRTGIHLHTALWASCLSGAAGAPMLWWWDDYVEPNDLYYHYRALGRFLAGVDWAGEAWAPVRDDERTNLRVVGLRTDASALLWFQDRRNTWHRRLVKGEPVRLLEPFTFQLDGIRPGQYRVEWFDTYDGAAITEAKAAADEKGLPIELSRLVKAPDVACRVAPWAEPPLRRPSW